MEIKVTLNAWLPEFTQEEFAAALERSDEDWMTECLILRRKSIDMSTNWALVGEVEVTARLLDINEIKGNLAETLRKQIKDLQAETYAKVKGMEEKIQNLLAIGFDSPKATPTPRDSNGDDTPF